MHFAALLHALGLLLLIFSFVYIPPLVLAFFEGWLSIRPFFHAAMITAGCGILCILVGRRAGGRKLDDLDRQDGFLLAMLFWVAPCAFGALPFLMSTQIGLSVTDAVFESFSGLTTTGATILTGLNELPRSLLLYRQLLQWIGGIGLVIAAIALVPFLGIGGMQLYLTQAPGHVGDTKLKPRVTETARALFYFYCLITVLCAIGYALAGMGIFDAICHSLSTVSIGGFSTHDESFGYFADTPLIMAVAMIFMVIAGINFALHFFAVRRGLKGITAYFRDRECRLYFLVIGSAVLLCTACLYSAEPVYEGMQIWRGVFNAVSITTTTGFLSSELHLWPVFLPPMIMAFAFIGTCAGSAGGGLKVIRVLILLRAGLRELHVLVHPNAVRHIKVGDRIISDQVLRGVWSFLILYMVTFVGLLFGLLIIMPDFTTAFYAVVATINNLGPGLGEVSQNYREVPDSAKWLLSTSMLLGRLELMSLLVLLTPGFWRR
jgi:trk system potassium uptake protein TrkH